MTQLSAYKPAFHTSRFLGHPNTSPTRFWLCLPLLAASLWFPSHALACAGLVHNTEALAESPAQQAIFTPSSDGGHTLEYRVAWEGNAADFGWIVVVPDSFVDLEDGEVDHFFTLEAETAMHATSIRVDNAEEGCGCGTALKGDAGNFTDSGIGGVEIVDQGFTGTYAWQALAASEPDSLTAWLDAHDWSAGETGGTLTTYAAEGGWLFLLIEIQPGSEELGAGGGSLPPVLISFSDQRMIFPARISRTAGPVELGTTFWFRSESAVSVSGFTLTDFQSQQRGSESPEATRDNALREIGGDQPGLARTWTGTTSLGRVTRLDGIVDAAAHTVDATFTLSGTAEDWQPGIESDTVSPSLIPGFWGLLGMGFGTLGFAGLRRRRA